MADSDLPGTPPVSPLPLSDAAAVPVTTGSSAAPPVPPPRIPNWQGRAAQLQAEYVAGGGYPFLTQYIRSLPYYIDDATRDFGDDLYDQILLDCQVSPAIRLLKESALESGVRLEPAVQTDQTEAVPDDEEIGEYKPARSKTGQFRPKTDDEKDKEDKKKRDKEDADLAEEITDFCEKDLLDLERPFVEVLYEMLDAVALGNKVAEQVYEPRRDEDGKVRVHLKALKVKPRKTTAFVVDPFMNVVGVLGLIPGMAFPVITNQIVAQTDKIPNLLPRNKFAVLTWDGKGNDPRGNSLLRPVYNPWFLKKHTIAEYARYLVKFAGPSLIGYTAQNAQPVPAQDALGNVIPGQPLVSPEQMMLSTLLSFSQGTAAVFPFGAKVDPLMMSGDGGAYLKAVTLFDQQITKAILCQTLATESPSHMTRAAAETHQDVLDIVVIHIKAMLAAMIRFDILRNLVTYNWGKDVARRLTPKVHLAGVPQHNWASDASAVATLVSSQFLDRSQFPELDARLGLPRRSPTPEGPAGPGGAMPGKPGMPGMPGGLPGKPGGNGQPQPGQPPATFSMSRPPRVNLLMNQRTIRRAS